LLQSHLHNPTAID